MYFWSYIIYDNNWKGDIYVGDFKNEEFDEKGIFYYHNGEYFKNSLIFYI